MKEIPLSQGQVALVDDADYEMISALSWHAHKDKVLGTYYAVHNQGRKYGWHKIRMHRIIIGAKRGEYVDHIDHNTLNNCRSNLRICKAYQNQGNQVLRKDSKTGYKGVKKARNGFTANITVFGRHKYIGYYATAQEAADAYDKAAINHFGSYALTNQLLYRAENSFREAE